jgi:serine/threonine-protein kinase
MSPEQKAGKDVTVRSDLYSLGLVLHEMFTGKARKDTQSSPSEIVKDLDPAIERLILRCLEEDPKRRPSTALNVAMALPGADPIAAALAAGETPSPEMVAASQEKEGFSNRVTILLFAAIAVLLLPTAWSTGLVTISGKARIGTPPDALAYRAQQILAGFGYSDAARYTAYGFDCCHRRNFDDVVRLGQQRATGILATHQPPVLRFWYRQHRRPMVPDVSTVNYDAPSNDEPGMIRLGLDARGRLIGLEARPEPSAATSATTPDESKLFEEAGLDRGRFQPTAPRAVPPMAFDTRLAWIGTYRDDLTDPVRVEAAWWQGRPVYLNVAGDQQPSDERQDTQPAARPLVSAIAAVVAMLGAALAAAHNLRMGRGDRRGAAFVGWIMFLTGLGLLVLQGTHALSFAVFSNWMIWLAVTTSSGLLAWIAYIAIEPFVRRQTPDALISWTRLYSGHLRDPLVAAHVLVGIAVMLGNMLVGNLVMRFVADVWILPLPSVTLESLGSPADFAARLLSTVLVTFLITFLLLILTVVFRVVVRRPWIADIAACTVIGALGLYAYTGPVGFVMNALFTFVTLTLLRRFGYLAMLSAWWAYGVIASVPFSLDSWYTGRLLVALALPTLVAGWALWVILSNKRQLSTESVA